MLRKRLPSKAIPETVDRSSTNIARQPYPHRAGAQDVIIPPMGEVTAWVVSIVVIALACRLPHRVLNVLMILGLAFLAVWTLTLFTL